MKIELRRVTYSPRLSQETSAFAADIWIDGAKVGTVENDGHGGANRVHPYALEKRLAEHAATLPPVVSKDGTKHDVDVEELTIALFERWLVARKLTALMRRHVVLVDEGKVYQVKGGVEAIPSIGARYPKAEILNTIPIDRAVTAYLKATAT